MTRVLVLGLALLVPWPAAAQEGPKDKGKSAEFKVDGKLSPDDPRDKKMKQSPHQVHTFKMTAGKTYIIDLVSPQFDTFLRLEDANGTELAFNDDVAPGNLNSQIVFKAPKDGEYRLIVTSFDGKSGTYTLTAREATGAAGELQALKGELQQKQQQIIQKFGQAKTEKERDQLKDQFYDTLGEYVLKYCKFAKEHADDPAAGPAANEATQLLRMVGDGGSANFLKHLREAEKIAPKRLQGTIGLAIAKSLRGQFESAYQHKDKSADRFLKEAEESANQIAKDHPDLSKQVEEFLFELKHLTVGQKAMEIEAEDLDGKKFKLSDYKGKVVVLDFWGNW